MARRILVIEDNQMSLELTVYLLQAFGYAVLTATNGLEGLELIKREKPDLIICDIDLPKMNGYEVASYLNEDPQLCRIPLIAFTALAMVGDRERVLAAGFDGYMSKPIIPEQFIKQVEAFL